VPGGSFVCERERGRGIVGPGWAWVNPNTRARNGGPHLRDHATSSRAREDLRLHRATTRTPPLIRFCAKAFRRGPATGLASPASDGECVRAVRIAPGGSPNSPGAYAPVTIVGPRHIQPDALPTRWLKHMS